MARTYPRNNLGGLLTFDARPSVLSCLLSCLLCLLCVIAAGCGSAGSPADTGAPGATGRAAFMIRWPDAADGRLVPAAARSVSITIRNGDSEVAGGVIARPQTSLHFPVLPAGTLNATAVAHPNDDGTGTGQARATAPLVIVAGRETAITLTMATTVERLRVSPSPARILLGEAVMAEANGVDADGATVLLDRSQVRWTSSNPAVAAVDDRGVVKGVAPGDAVITATDSESGRSGQETFTVRPVLIVTE